MPLFCIFNTTIYSHVFHTEDDFKPASIDHSKEAELVVGPKGEVNITLPNDQVSRMGKVLESSVLMYRIM